MIIGRILGSISGARLEPVLASITSSGTPTAPTITTSTSSVDANELLLAGTFSGTTSRYFQYGASSGSLNETLTLTNSQTSKSLTGLGDSETVYFRAVGENNSYTRTITGTINPNYYSTTVTITYGLASNLSDGVTQTVGTFTGSTAQAFSFARTSQVAGTTYYYRLTATNIFTSVQSSIFSYTASAAVTNGITRNQTTAAALNAPSITWENSESTREDNFRLRFSNTYYTNNDLTLSSVVWQYSSNSSGPWTNGGNMSLSSTLYQTPLLNPNTVANATTYTYYRARITDQYGRTANSNVRGVAPINLQWGWDVGGNHTAGSYDTDSSAGSLNISFPGETEYNAVTLASFLGLTRYRVLSVRWDASVSPSGNLITTYNRRWREYYVNAFSSRKTYFDNQAGSSSFTNNTDYPDNALARTNSNYWTTDTLYFGGGDMPVSGSPSKYSDGTTSIWSGSLQLDVIVTVSYEIQSLATITANSSTLYYAS